MTRTEVIAEARRIMRSPKDAAEIAETMEDWRAGFIETGTQCVTIIGMRVPKIFPVDVRHEIAREIFISAECHDPR